VNALSPIGTYDTVDPRVISDAEAQIVGEIMQAFYQAVIWRSPFGGHWEETAELIDPNSRNTFFYQNYNTPGVKKTQQQIDAHGGLALHRFTAIANSLITPRNARWHGLEADDPYVMKDRATKLYFEQLTDVVFRQRYAPTANFFSQNIAVWRSLGAYGNGTMFCDALDGRLHGGARGLRYKAVPLGETFFEENHQGQVCTMYRWFRRTAYQAVQQWGLSALPAGLAPALKANSQWPYNFLHCVKPRANYDPQAIGPRGMPYCSYYVSIEGKCLMAPEGGYRMFPFPVARYVGAPGEVYYRGPAQIVLPALKTKNAQKRAFLKSAHRAVDPVLFTNDDGIVGGDFRPGALNKGGVTSDGKMLVHALPAGDIQISKEAMAEEASLIDGGFLVDLFKVMFENPNMTATQVIELVNEKGMLVAPTLGGQFDYINQMTEREVDILSDMIDVSGRPMVPPMPPRLREAKGAYRVVDTSPLALAAKAGAAAGFIRSVESTRELVNVTQDPSLLDPYDFDVAIPRIAEINGVPESWMSDGQAIAAKRKARADQQKQQQQIEAAPAQAAMIKARAVAAKTGALEQPQQGQQQPGGF
jgi:hypothetical protein